MSRELKIFVDGACRGNPGPAGIGVVIFEGESKIKEISKSIGSATNNIAEYTALIYALQEALMLKADKLHVFTDSELVYNQVIGKYKVKHKNIIELFAQVKHLCEGITDFKIQHVPREQNKEADKLASGSISKDLKVSA